MKCDYCGAEVAEGQSYCMCCGTRQERNVLPMVEETVKVEESAVVPAVAVQPEEVLPAEQEFPVIELPERKLFRPALQLPTGRALWKMILLGLVTLGIYPTVIWSRTVTELNITASRYDGKRTMPYFAMVVLAPVTLGIYAFVWMHKFCRRISDELNRRGIDYQFGPAAFWLWNILGSLILVGPFVFTHKLLKAMNKINADFNVNG